MYKIKLYVIGQTPSSVKATVNLRTLLEDQFKSQYALEVIDLLENPSLAEEDKILATPTAVRYLPEPIKKMIGNLSDREKVLLGLDLVPLG
jgi:circadian clock protein KaiB